MVAPKRKNAGDGKSAAESGSKVRRTGTGKAAADASVKAKRSDKQKQFKSKKGPDKTSTAIKKSSSVRKNKLEKGAKPHSATKKNESAALVQQVVSMWEDLRPRQASTEVKQKLVSDILNVSKGKIKDLAVKSKASRVVQAMLKNGSKEQQQKIWNECKDHIIEISMSLYGNHVMRKLISIASKEQLSDLYDELPAAERNGLIAEFYSRETALLGAKTSTATLKSLVEAWPSMDGTDRRSTMQRLILALQPIIEKGYVDPAPIHRLVSEYMRLAPADMLQDTVDSLIGEATLRMLHTHEGCRVGCMVAAYSTPKQRKKLVKSMKGHVVKMCLDEFAYIALIKTLAVVDDTELVRKNLVPELQSNLEELLESLMGIKVILSLVSSDEKHLPPHARELHNTPERTVTVAISEQQQDGEADDAGNTDQEGEEKESATETHVLGISKKEPLVRRKELLGTGKASLSVSLIEHCTQHAAELLGTQHGGELLECLACGHDISSWLWEQREASISALQSAIAAALKDTSSHGKESHPRGDSHSAAKEAKQGDEKDDDSENENSEGDGSEDEEEEKGEDGSKSKGKPKKEASAGARKKKRAAAYAEAGKDLSQNFFATRSLKRMATCAQGSCGDSFKTKLWEEAIKGNVAKLKSTHACKVIAALAQCNVPSVEKDVKKELSQALQGEDLDGFLRQFAKPKRARQ